MPTQFNATQLAQLKSEFVNDPRGYGYAQYWSMTPYDNALRDFINCIRDGTAHTTADGIAVPAPTNPTGAGGSADGKITRYKTSVPQGDIIAVIDGRDIGGITNGQSAFLNAMLCYCNSPSGQTKLVLADSAGVKSLIRQNLDRLLADTNGTQTRLDALAVRFGSRAEELFGTDTVVTTDDVSACRQA